MEDELVVIVYSTKNTVAEVVEACARIFSLQESKNADADGLIEYLGRAIRLLGITNIFDKASVLNGIPILNAWRN